MNAIDRLRKKARLEKQVNPHSLFAHAILDRNNRVVLDGEKLRYQLYAPGKDGATIGQFKPKLNQSYVVDARHWRTSSNSIEVRVNDIVEAPQFGDRIVFLDAFGSFGSNILPTMPAVTINGIRFTGTLWNQAKEISFVPTDENVPESIVNTTSSLVINYESGVSTIGSILAALELIDDLSCGINDEGEELTDVVAEEATDVLVGGVASTRTLRIVGNQTTRINGIWNGVNSLVDVTTAKSRVEIVYVGDTVGWDVTVHTSSV
jgi:hypothetical protein